MRLALLLPWRAATFRMKMTITDLKGDLIYARAGPFNKGNVYSEHTVNVPEHLAHRFVLRFYNEATVWFYIEKLTLERPGTQPVAKPEPAPVPATEIEKKNNAPEARDP